MLPLRLNHTRPSLQAQDGLVAETLSNSLITQHLSSLCFYQFGAITADLGRDRGRHDEMPHCPTEKRLCVVLVHYPVSYTGYTVFLYVHGY